MRRSLLSRALKSSMQIELAALAAARRAGAFLWYARPAITSAFKDAGLTPAGVGDLVQQLTDVAAGVRSASQPSSAAQPTISVDGQGRMSLSMTTSQCLLSDVTPSGAGSFIIGTTAMTASTNRALIGARLSSTSDRFFVYHSAVNTIALRIGTGGASTATVIDGSASVLSLTAIEGGQAILRSCGAVVGSEAVAGTLRPTAPFAIGGVNNAGAVTLFGGMPISLVCVSDSVIPDAERAAIERLACLVTGSTFAG